MPSKKKDPNSHTGVEDTSIIEEIVLMPSTLETIDYSVFDYINDGLDLHTSTNKGFVKTPVIWVTPERAYQIKNNKEVRDKEETLILPLISIERKAVIKDPNKRAIPYSNIIPANDERGGTITIARKINQEKTSNFQAAQRARKTHTTGHGQRYYPGITRGKTVYQTVSIPLPVWVSVDYEISLRAEYQQQMNDFITKLIRQGGQNRIPFLLSRAGHKFEAFIDGSFAHYSNISSVSMEQRNYETVVKIEVLGYLIGDGPNQDSPKIVVRENAVDVKIPRERVIYGDIPEHIDKRGFYKE